MTLIDRALDTLKATLVSLGRGLIRDLEMATGAFQAADPDKAREVEATGEAFAGRYHIFEEDCFKTLALHQPVARDLREVMGIYKTGQDMERIHSLIERIGKKTRKIENIDSLVVPEELVGHLCQVTAMLVKGISIINGGPENPEELVAMETTSSEFKRTVRRAVEIAIADHPDRSRDYMLLMGIGRHADRIARLVSSMIGDHQWQAGQIQENWS